MRGLGAIIHDDGFAASDLMLPGSTREIGEQWIFGRGDRDDLEAAADDLASTGIRRAAPERQAALETLFARFIADTHAGALDDAQVVVPEEAVIQGDECLLLHEIMREKIDRLRFDATTLPIFEQEMRSLGRLAIEMALAGPVLQWRAQIAAKFLAVALEAREFALTDALRDIPAENVGCQSFIGLSRLQIARERFQ